MHLHLPGGLAANHEAKMQFIADLYSRPIAVKQDKANEQHYEVPTSFLKTCLGPRMKYSSCIWPCLYSNVKTDLADAEDAMLSSYCLDARLGPGLRGVGVDSQDGKDVKVNETNGDGGKGGGREGEGLRILDLGCGWGSLGLFLAEVS